MINLTEKEKTIADQIFELKKQAGTHSPSLFTLKQQISNLEIKIDACFLSNPYATDLFLEYFKKELIETGDIRDILEFYPAQNQQTAKILAPHLNIDPKCLFIGNGASEIIQAIIHNFTKEKLLINIPTFSAYYEFTKPNCKIIYNKQKKEDQYLLDSKKYIELAKKEKPDTAIIINPNNPDGRYLPLEEIHYILEELQEIETIIVDESFIHFAYENTNFYLNSSIQLTKKYPNLVIIKSMSKDFGIAGIRAGYAIMSPERVQKLLKNGYLWNISGLAEYFFQLYVREDFLEKYEKLRIQYIKETQAFHQSISNIPNLTVYPSMANFLLIELLNISSDDFMIKSLVSHGIYVRTCGDKIGLEGEFIRLASRKKSENQTIIESINNIINE